MSKFIFLDSGEAICVDEIEAVSYEYDEDADIDEKDWYVYTKSGNKYSLTDAEHDYVIRQLKY